VSQIVFIEESRPTAQAPDGFALFALGFRPFYLLAGFFAALSIVVWAVQFTGILPISYLPGPLWHAHEMLFGFTLAVVVGFLFTAGRNWSNQPTPTGATLASLALLWIAGRVLVITPYAVASVIVNTAFPLAAALTLALPFWRARLVRNYGFVALLVLMAGAELAANLSLRGVIDGSPLRGLQVGLDTILVVMAVMAGRVVPMFTNNGVVGAGARRQGGVEHAALGTLLALLVADAIGLDGPLLATIALVAALVHAVRWWLWRPWRTLRVPIVWILHAAYAWIPMHLTLRAGATLGIVTSSSATHAFTAGAAGALILGMMTRTSRGHTGRPLKADAWDVAAYVAVLLAGFVRVGVPLATPELSTAAILVSATLWSAAFAIFTVRYAPSLLRPRADGRPG